MDTAFFLKTFAALFAIMSPIANLPVFLTLTDDMTTTERRIVALTAGLGVALGAAGTLLGGQALLTLFGISIDGFRVAGGLLILLIALDLVHGGRSDAHQGAPKERQDFAQRRQVAVFPLTVPILLGPGSIATLVVFAKQAEGYAQETALWAAAAGIAALLTVTFVLAGAASRLLGQAAISIMGRVMGMILAAIAIEMLVSGLKALLPGLA